MCTFARRDNDYCTASPPEGETEREAALRSSSLSLFLTSLQCILFSVCTSIPILQLQYLTFVLQVLNRSFLYGGNLAFISIAWVGHWYYWSNFVDINDTKQNSLFKWCVSLSAFQPVTLGSCMAWWCVYQQLSPCCSTPVSLWLKGL